MFEVVKFTSFSDVYKTFRKKYHCKSIECFSIFVNNGEILKKINEIDINEKLKLSYGKHFSKLLLLKKEQIVDYKCSICLKSIGKT